MIFDRLVRLIGEKNLAKLAQARVLVFGVGGVGGYVVEALARSGVGHITVVDDDVFEDTNINRQILATTSVIGQDKVAVCKARCLDINPQIDIDAIKLKFEASAQLDFSIYDYVIDAVDEIEAKVAIIRRAQDCGKSVISCMGTAKKFDPQKLDVAMLSATSVCPLAAIMRKRMRDGEINDCLCVFSSEKPQKSEGLGSTAFVPSVAGILIAKTVILDLIKG